MAIKQPIKFVNKDRTNFFVTLKARVDEHFRTQQISKHANAAMVIKTTVLLAFYILPFVALLSWQPTLGLSLTLWSIMGLAVAGLGMSVMHDAIHGAYSSNRYVNQAMGYVLNLLGGATFNWKLQHNVLHHTYTNIATHDDDIADRLVMRFSPHTEVKSFQRFQWIYAFLFYGILTLYWVTAKDFVQFFKFTAEGVNTDSPRQNALTLTRIILLKVVYLGVMLVLPTVWFGLPFGQVLGGFLLMHFIAGLVLTTVFQLAHTVEGTDHPLPNAKGQIENEWAIHQMHTTVNFAPGNRLLSWYVGGLNYQVEHHLFPHICHVHYPDISPIVAQTAREFGIPYQQNPTFGSALRSHVRLLQRFGRLPDLNEAIG